MLKTYDVTGDEVWLERARSFAIAALEQLQQRYSLMTGDIGAALFAQGASASTRASRSWTCCEA